MVIADPTGNRLPGVYRGIVKKHLPHGNCKIFIPGVYDEQFYDYPDSLPTAQPATPLFAGTNEGNGVFSYPNLSSIVWCLFLNGDANYPVYWAATLGGDDAIGQYDIIFNQDDAEVGLSASDKHMITSGKTHVLWYENGKLSAIVEDPIRTQCSVTLPDYDKYDNNISDNTDERYTLSNVIVSAINELQLSNINCQLVLDNNADVHGELSTSTHWYDIIDQRSEDGNLSTNGTISVDNRNIMNNDGNIIIDTLSILHKHDNNGSARSGINSTLSNRYQMSVPGKVHNSVHLQLDNSENSESCNSMLLNDSYHVLEFDTDANFGISAISSINTTLNDIQNKKQVSIKADLTNVHNITAPGKFEFDSKLNTHSLIIQSEKSESGEDSELTTSEYVNNTAAIYNSTDGFTTLATTSSYTLYDDKTNVFKRDKLDNTFVMDEYGNILVQTYKNINDDINKSIATEQKSTGKIEFDSNGNFNYTSKFKLKKTASGAVLELDNIAKVDMTSYEDALSITLIIGNRKNSGALVVDAKYLNVINATTSTANIQIIDNLTNNECVDNKNAKDGTTEIRVTGKSSGMHCTIIMTKDGKMQITTTDDLTITTTNTVNVKTNVTNIDSQGGVNIKGNTDIKGTLHVSGLITSDTDVKSRVTLNTHTHIGDGGPTPGLTTPPVA